MHPLHPYTHVHLYTHTHIHPYSRVANSHAYGMILTHLQSVCLTVARGECISSRASGTLVTTSLAGE